MAEILTLVRADIAMEKDSVIDVRPDGFNWGRKERDPTKFAILKVRGTVRDHIHLMEADEDGKRRWKATETGGDVVPTDTRVSVTRSR